MDRILLLIIHH